MKLSRWSVAVGVATVAVVSLMVSVRDLSWSSHLPEDPLEGMGLFVKKGCINCHAIQGQGGKAGPDLAKVQVGHSFLGLAGIMWNHLPKMAMEFRRLHVPHPKLTQEEASRIMALLYSLSFLDRRPDPVRGREEFDVKGCRGCHSVGGQGGFDGPPLDGFGGKVSPAFVAAAFWDRGLGMARTAQEKGIKWPRFEGDELADINAYLRTQGTARKEQRVYLKPGSPDAGRELFVSKGCIQCHAILGKGGRVGPDLGRHELKRSLTRIAGVIWNHGPGMWEEIVKRKLDLTLNPQQMLHLLSYLYFIQYSDPPGDAKAGRKVFEVKGCALCHRSASQGGGIGPDLAGKKLNSPTGVFAEMWNHGPKMGEQARAMGMTWPNLGAGEMADLIAYIRSIQRQRPAVNR
ncbi:MAG: c-type cytochrome [Nitrospinota bacterium]